MVGICKFYIKQDDDDTSGNIWILVQKIEIGRCCDRAATARNFRRHHVLPASPWWKKSVRFSILSFLNYRYIGYLWIQSWITTVFNSINRYHTYIFLFIFLFNKCVLFWGSQPFLRHRRTWRLEVASRKTSPSEGQSLVHLWFRRWLPFPRKMKISWAVKWIFILITTVIII